MTNNWVSRSPALSDLSGDWPRLSLRSVARRTSERVGAPIFTLLRHKSLTFATLLLLSSAGCPAKATDQTAAKAEPSRAMLCSELDVTEAVTFTLLARYHVPIEPQASLRTAYAFARRTCPVSPSSPKTADQTATKPVPTQEVLCPEFDVIEAVTFELLAQYHVPAEPQASLRSAYASARHACPVSPPGPSPTVDAGAR